LLERRCVDLATSDPEERPHDRPDHSPEERIRRDLETELSFVVLAPLRAPDRANTTRSRREGREVFATQQPLARIPHRRDIERSRNVELAAPLERIPLSAVSDPIFLCPPRRREPEIGRASCRERVQSSAGVV